MKKRLIYQKCKSATTKCNAATTKCNAATTKCNTTSTHSHLIQLPYWLQLIALALLLGAFTSLGAVADENKTVPQTASSAKSSDWQTWAAESYTLAAGEAFQFRVDFSDIPLRRWRLIVEGGDWTCDLSVLRLADESLVYYKTSESRHEISIPWGQEESIIVALTNRGRDGAFVVTLLGPPSGTKVAAYSYNVNRALEAYATGQPGDAERFCTAALKDDPQDSVAKVLQAGFLRDDNFFEQAATVLDEALAGDLTGEMKELAEVLRAELRDLRSPLPSPVRDGVVEVENLLTSGKGQPALDICDRLLDGNLELRAAARGRILMLRGRSLALLERNFEAIDAYTGAIAHTRSHAAEAIIYFHMGSLFYQMENLIQSQGAFTIALKYGLPSGLHLQAREKVVELETRISQER